MNLRALSLAWAPVREGRRFSRAVRGLAAVKGAGCYVIREGSRVVYVGRSQAHGEGGIYSTLTRHFQRWRRRRGKVDRSGRFGEVPGITYDGAACEVAIIFATSAGEAATLEARLIEELDPRDNTRREESALEDAPF